MEVLLLPPGEKPKPVTIDGSLESMQSLVGGLIQAVFPFADPTVVMVCNDEGKLMGLPLNRSLRNSDGTVYDVVSGTCFLCSAPSNSDSFESLSKEQMDYYTQYYAHPEMFIKAPEGLVILKI